MTPIKVLVADDHQIVLDGILAFLEKEKEIDVIHTALTGEEVLKKLQKEPVDVAILDINMPKMDGLETSRYILRNYPKIKVLLLTMIGDGNFILNALKTGVHGYVIKEKSKESLVGAIHSVYRGARYWSPELLDRIAEQNLAPEPETEPVEFTTREQEVLCIMVESPGYTSEQIGNEMNISPTTVDTHIRNMKAKLNISRRQELITYAMKNQLCQ